MKFLAIRSFNSCLWIYFRKWIPENSKKNLFRAETSDLNKSLRNYSNVAKPEYSKKFRKIPEKMFFRENHFPEKHFSGIDFSGKCSGKISGKIGRKQFPGKIGAGKNSPEQNF